MTHRLAPLLLAVAVLFSSFNTPVKAEPRRVVSLNPCLDIILVNVADREQIAALSHFARDPAESTISDIAETLPFTWESAEEVLSLKPDLVLTAQHSSLATRKALSRLGLQTELFGVPETIAESFAQIRQIAMLVNRVERGEVLIARVEAAINAAKAPEGFKPLEAIVYQPNGLVAGSGSLIDEMMDRTGFKNVASRYGIERWGTVTLEQLLNDPPRVLLAGELLSGKPTWAERVLSHPALRSVASVMHRAPFPQQLLYCGGPVLEKTAQTLAASRLSVHEANQ